MTQFYSTQSPNVITLKDFEIPQLQSSRNIRVYLPLQYFENDDRYSVIYMHDGQNLFDETTSVGEEWGIDEYLNTIDRGSIVVGIDNGDERIKEYNFFNHEEFGEAKGNDYLLFITQTLKPYIDLNFKTLSDRDNTFMAGSSMGGLLSLFGSLLYAEVFGGAGIFSPSLWLVKDKLNIIEQLAGHQLPQRLYFYGGLNEGENMVEYISTVHNILQPNNHLEIHVDIMEDGEHTEGDWKKKFPDFYNWLLRN